MKKNKRLELTAYAVAFVAAIIAGWYWRSPNTEAINIMFRAKSQWKQDLILERLRLENMALFGNEYFNFNFAAGFLVAIAAWFIFHLIAKEKNWLQD